MKINQIFSQQVKNYYHLANAVLANFWYGFPSKKIRIIGVTGTNGKTTTCQMITRILEESGAKVAMASTINFKLGEKEWVNATKFTTLSAWKVQEFIREAVKLKCDYLVLETSSHALDQDRVWGVQYDTAVMTNVTREHLDYHKTMDEYRLAKLKLFNRAKNVVVNLDMEMPKDYLVYRAKSKYGYTLREKNFCNKYDCGEIKMIKAEEIELGLTYSKFKIQNSKFSLCLPGEFNIENALAAICVGLHYGVDLAAMGKALEKITCVPGRLEYVPNDKGLNIIVDYALTPDSLEKLYQLISQIRTNSPQLGSNSRVIAVFGSCGDRDRGKRPIMGEIVDKYADYIFVTNEDPYTEDPMRIINEVASGVKNKKEGETFWKVFDRREAIQKAINLAKSGDVIVVTGKGAEETMMIGNKMIPWNDKKVILEELARQV